MSRSPGCGRIIFFIFTIIFVVMALFSLIGALMVATGDEPPSSLIFSIVFLLPLFLTALITGLKDASHKKSGKWTIFRLILAGLLLIFMICAGVYTATYSGGCARRLGPGAQAAGCSFEGVDLTGRDLHEANLLSANLKKAVLRNANLGHANLTNAKLNEADLTDANLKEATLDGVDLTGATGLTDQALASALGIELADLPAVTAQKQIRLEQRDGILNSLKPACTGEGVPGTLSFIDDSQRHTLVLLDALGDPSSDWGKIPANNKWEPMALRFTDLVACADHQVADTYETCSYTGSDITRYQYDVHIRIVIAATGETLVEDTISGSIPDECPARAPVDQTTIYGRKLTQADITTWLAEFINNVPKYH